jgi:hypothetical protein
MIELCLNQVQIAPPVRLKVSYSFRNPSVGISKYEVILIFEKITSEGAGNQYNLPSLR